LTRLHDLNVQTKIITGDNETITAHICEEIGIPVKGILLGSEIDTLSDEALQKKILSADIFVRVNPEQKLRIIKSLQKLGHTVGYLGDGINDIPSLRGADVGLSVNTAVDVAKDAAAIVLLRKSLDVIADGIIEGRKTFNNTIKYILMATSSNFGNMFSAAGASFFLPFLPMTPVQILLTNGIYDISQTGIPSDNVDPESLLKPRHWNIDFIKNYMIFFGPLSSVFDFATFGVMLFVFHARDSLFQTGWFIESIATEILIVFVIRTARTPFFLSKPSKWLFATCTFLTILGVTLPFTPLAKPLGFMVPPPAYFVILIFLISAYLFLVETVKSFFLKRFSL
jgi:Mg2+-importing ATPase